MSVCPKNKLEGHGESGQDRSKTSNNVLVLCRDMGSEESTREEVGCGGMRAEWSHQVGQNKE